MYIAEKINDIADFEVIREKVTPAMKAIRTYVGKGVRYVRAMPRIDAIIYTAVIASLGALISAVFSKLCKKLIVLFALVCTLGSAYLIYKNLFKD